MASKTSKWAAAVASAAVSVMMGAAAFAAPAAASGGTAAEEQQQARQDLNSLRSSDGGSDVVSRVLGKAASNVGTKVAEAKGQARRALNEAS